jgi:hypothetical protein
MNRMPLRDLPISLLLAAFFALVPAAGRCVDRGASPAPRVAVVFVDPEKFYDVGERHGSVQQRDARLTEIRAHLEKRAAAYLAPGQALEIAITGFDAAGAHEPLGMRYGDLRVVQGVSSPRIDLRYRLVAADGTLLKGGERRLRDLAYPLGSGALRDDPMRYEKALLDAWLERELAQPVSKPQGR